MKKIKVTFDYVPDFAMLAISSHQPDYRMCWLLNNTLEFDMMRVDDFEVHRANGENISFPMFSFVHEENHVTYILLKNSSHSGYLIPEMKKLDYFFFITGAYRDDDIEEIEKKIKEISQVLTAFRVNPDEVKSAKHLIFE